MNNTVTRQVLGKVAMTSRGEYDTSKSYEILDIVTYQGSSYLSKKYNNDSLPTNANDWQLLAQKGDTYELSEEDLQIIAEQITSNANSAFNQNVKEKTDSFNSNANSKTEAYNTNATEKLGTYNSNHTAKLKEYNDNATSKLSAYNANTVTKTTEYNSNHTNKLNAYNTNASNKIDEYNTNADTRLEEYNTNANNKIAEYDEHSKELNNKIVSIGNDYRMVKDQLLYTGEDTDTFIHVEDSAMAEMKEIKVDGVCKQVTTTGKNKFSVSRLPMTLGGVTLSVDKDGNVVLNGTPTITSDYINFIVSQEVEFEPGTYTMSVENKKDGIGTAITGFEGKLNLTLSETGNSKTYTSTEKYTSTLQINVRYDVGTLNNFILNPQLEAGKTKTTYEMFTGGQPSPSPDYPQEIKTITGSLKITSCEKNLFNGTDYSMIVNGVTISISRNRITLNGTATGAYNNSNSNYINVFPIKLAEIYSYSCTQVHGSMTGTKLAINLRGGNNTTDMSKQFNPASLELKNGSNSTSNSCIDCSYITGLQFIFSDDAVFDNYTFDIQLEQGRNVTPYEDYIESQIQAKLPENEFIGKLDDTYKDTLRIKYFPEEGQYHWMLDKKVGKYVFTGNENILLWQSASNIKQYYYILNTCLSTNNQNNIYAMSNYFRGVEWHNSWTKNNIITVGWGKRLFINSKDFTSIDDLKNFLSTNAVEAYYPLETPYTLDLGVIDMPISYKDITNIFTDSDLLPTINAKYYRVFDKTIQNAQINEKTLKQEITDLNTTVSALDNRLKALENKTIEEPTESEGTV